MPFEARAMKDTIAEDARKIERSVRAVRRDLHRYPELGFALTRTASLVAEKLSQLGLEVRTGVGRSGIVAVLRATSSLHPAVLLRADMDALPIDEASSHDYRSTVPDVMHACGHDAHTAILLGVAELLSSRRDLLPQDVVFCFQPAEELLTGAAAMIADGALDSAKIGAAYAMHIWSLFPVGTVHVHEGSLMAAADTFTIRIAGRGGHSSEPQNTNDPVMAAALTMLAANSLLPRSIEPREASVLSICSIHAGNAANVIPDEARLTGSLRALRSDSRDVLRDKLRNVVASAAATCGCSAEVGLTTSCPSVINAPACVDVIRRVAVVAVGSDSVFDMSPLMATEDFAHFLERVPGALFFLGAGNPLMGITAPHHSPQFDLDEAALAVGIELMTRIALEPVNLEVME
jgi:amidohydrolase